MFCAISPLVTIAMQVEYPMQILAGSFDEKNSLFPFLNGLYETLDQRIQGLELFRSLGNHSSDQHNLTKKESSIVYSALPKIRDDSSLETLNSSAVSHWGVDNESLSIGDENLFSKGDTHLTSSACKKMLAIYSAIYLKVAEGFSMEKQIETSLLKDLRFRLTKTSCYGSLNISSILPLFKNERTQPFIEGLKSFSNSYCSAFFEKKDSSIDRIKASEVLEWSGVDDSLLKSELEKADRKIAKVKWDVEKAENSLEQSNYRVERSKNKSKTLHENIKKAEESVEYFEGRIVFWAEHPEQHETKIRRTEGNVEKEKRAVEGTKKYIEEAKGRLEWGKTNLQIAKEAPVCPKLSLEMKEKNIEKHAKFFEEYEITVVNSERSLIMREDYLAKAEIDLEETKKNSVTLEEKLKDAKRNVEHQKKALEEYLKEPEKAKQESEELEKENKAAEEHLERQKSRLEKAKEHRKATEEKKINKLKLHCFIQRIHCDYNFENDCLEQRDIDLSKASRFSLFDLVSENVKFGEVISDKINSITSFFSEIYNRNIANNICVAEKVEEKPSHEEL